MTLPIDAFLQSAVKAARAKNPSLQATSSDPMVRFLTLMQQPMTERKAKKLAQDFYHVASLTGLPLEPNGPGNQAAPGTPALVTFLYYGARAGHVNLAGDFNQWSGDAEPLARVGKTGLFVLRRPVTLPCRYKLVVDKKWMPDPANPYAVPDGYGDYNSVLPHHPPPEASSRLVSHPDLYSKQLRNRRPLFLYLPPGYYASQQRYPVLYVMDGRENLHRGRLPELFDGAIGRGELPPFIAVFIPHAGRKRGLEYTPYFQRSRLNAYHQFMIQELVPFMDRMFRTLPVPEARTLLGQSFGGTVVSTLGLKAPHVFQHVLAQSGVYVWGRNQTVLTPFLELPTLPLRFYLDCVDNEPETYQNRAMHKVLTEKGYPHLYRAIPSRHEYEDWRERVVDGLRFLWFNIAPGQGQAPAGTRKGRNSAKAPRRKK